MAALTVTLPGAAGIPIASSVLNTLTASDTFSFSSGDLIHLRNVTAGALTPNFDGADGTVVGVPGVGPLSVSAGYTTPSIAAAAERFIRADDILAYLQGVTTITGGVGIICAIFRR